MPVVEVPRWPWDNTLEPPVIAALINAADASNMCALALAHAEHLPSVWPVVRAELGMPEAEEVRAGLAALTGPPIARRRAVLALPRKGREPRDWAEREENGQVCSVTSVVRVRAG